jgi:N-acetylglucosamine malate deacetylase 2
MSCLAGTNAADFNITQGSSRSALSQLLGRTLVLVAHPDDETACTALLQRARHATVMFCTDGAPSSKYFWGSYGSRRAYADIRSAEAKKSLAIIGKTDPEFLRHPHTHERFKDQELYQDVTGAFAALFGRSWELQPEAIVAPAYEGGHPDHDASCFLAHLLGKELAIPVWEMPLYHRAPNGEVVHQEFLQLNGTEIVIALTNDEVEQRREMFAAYVSQPDASDFVKALVEVYRPQIAYDFAQPPHAGKLNYEAWGWPMTGIQLGQAFQAHLGKLFRQRTFRATDGIP